jgi:hypothetical protein
VNYRLVVHPELRQEVNRLYEAWKHDPSSDAGREFDPPMTMQDGRAAPDGPPIRQILAFNHRRDEPAAIAGERLGRQRGIAQGELHGLTGGGRPSVGRQREGVQITPHRMPVPNDVLQQILRDSPPAGSGPRPSAAPQARVNRPEGPGEGRERG